MIGTTGKAFPQVWSQQVVVTTWHIRYHITHHNQRYITANCQGAVAVPGYLVLGRAGRYCVTNFPSFSPVHNIHMSAINQFRRPPGGKKCEDYPLIAQHEHNCMFPGSTLRCPLGESSPGNWEIIKISPQRGTDWLQVNQVRSWVGRGLSWDLLGRWMWFVTTSVLTIVPRVIFDNNIVNVNETKL